jgi:hypothetical protein
MSNKTFFKRIALTAIAAMGFGMLSVVPSSAQVLSNSLTIDAATDSIDVGDSATATLTNVFYAETAADSVVVRAVLTQGDSTKSGSIRLAVSDSSTSVAGDLPEYLSVGVSSADANGVQSSAAWNLLRSDTGTNFNPDSLTISSATAGRSVRTSLRVINYNPGKAGTYEWTFFTTATNSSGVLVSSSSVTWTVTVSAISATAASAASTLTLRRGDAAIQGTGGTEAGTFFGGTAEGTDSQTLASRSTSTTTTTPGFSLVVKLKDGKTSTLGNLAQESYTVTVSGEAWITNGTDGASGAAAAATVRPTTSTGVKWLRMATPVADSATIVRVWSTGTAGTATLTVTTDSGVTIGTKTVTFHGPVTALAVTTSTKKVIQSGTATASSGVFSVTATDAGGRAVTGLSMSIVSSNVAAISSGSCVDASSSSVTDGIYSCSVNPVVTSTSGATATLTARVLDPADLAGLTYLTTTYDVTMGGAISTMVLTTDKATYEPGEAMVVTATAKDASGNTPYDGQSGPTLRANKALGGTAAGTSITMNAFYDGKSTSQTRSAVVRTMTNDVTLFAPAASGKFVISGLDGQTTPASVSVTATVGDDGATAAANAASDAAAEAIDAANAATDAANLAAEAADAATVAAEEARDAADAATAAVEELATQVATLMAALKAQITTLANTVAKIAKKVKA